MVVAFQPPVRASGESGCIELTQTDAYLPLCQKSDRLQRFYCLTREIEACWRDVGADDAECCRDTDAIIEPAIKGAEECLTALQRQKAEIEMHCSQHLSKIQTRGARFPGDLDLELSRINQLPSSSKMLALQRVENFSSLCESRAALLTALGRRPEPVDDDYAKVESEVASLRSGVEQRRSVALTTAESACAVWRELGETPQDATDDCLVAALDAAKTGMDVTVSDTVMADVKARGQAWELRRAHVATEVGRLHSALRGFGSPDAAGVEKFVERHASLHSADRTACRQKLRELQAALRKQHASRAERLSYIYEVTGVGLQALTGFFDTLDEKTGTVAEWTDRFEAEFARMEKYYSSLREVLGRLEELHGLMMEGSPFAEAKRVGEVSAVHFLEEEKYRKALARRYPGLREAILTDIRQWEAATGQTLQYHGVALAAQLAALSPEAVTTANAYRGESARGLLAVVEPLLNLLSGRGGSFTLAPTSPAPSAASGSTAPSSRPGSAARARTPLGSHRSSTPSRARGRRPSETPALPR